MEKEITIFKTKDIRKLTMEKDKEGYFNIIAEVLEDNIETTYELYKVLFSDQSEFKISTPIEFLQGNKTVEINLDLAGDLLPCKVNDEFDCFYKVTENYK